MSTDEPMNDLLSELASTDVPSPEPAFVERLDARLRIAHAERATVSSPRARWVPAVAVAAVLVAGLAGAIVIDDRETLVVGGVDQQPADPDRSATGGPGDDEGADPRPTISVKPTASGSTSGTESQPDRPDGSSPSTTIASDGPTTAQATDVDTGSTTVVPEPTRPAPTRPTGTSQRPTTTSSVRPTTATTTAPPGRIGLTATEVDGDRLRLDWVIGRDLAPMGWRIRAQRGDRATTLLVIRGGDARSATLERAQTVGRSLWVEAVDRSGRTLAASDPITIR